MDWKLTMKGRIAAIEECVSKKGNRYSVILFLQGTKSKQIMIAQGAEKQFADAVNAGDCVVEMTLRESFKFGNNFTALSVTMV